MNIPFHDFSGTGQTIHFAHANAYPPGCYRQFIAPFLDQHHVIGIKHRPMWPNSNHQTFHSWQTIADDLIDFLDQQGLKNIIGMGHSLGAIATILASIKRPDLFSQLVLIDPVLLPPAIIWSSHLTPMRFRPKLIPIMAGALRRRDSWDSQETLFESYRQKQIFSLMPDDTLWDFVKHGTEPTADGRIKLAYPKAWEARIYATPYPIWRKLSQIIPPTLGIRAEHSQTPNPRMWLKWQSIQTTATFVEMKGVTHLVPLEQPAQLAEVVLNHLKNKR